MKNTTQYFSHDYNSFSDIKIQAMIQDYGILGYGIYWFIIELLYQEEDHKLYNKKYTFKAISKQTQTEEKDIKEFIKDCVNEYELFQQQDNYIYSNRVNRQIEKRTKISQQRSKAGKKGVEKKNKKANAKQTETIAKQKKSNAKQNSAKESKAKESKINKTFIPPVSLEEWLEYSQEYAEKYFNFDIDREKVKALLTNSYEFWFDTESGKTNWEKKNRTDWKKTVQQKVRRENAKLRNYSNPNIDIDNFPGFDGV